MTTNSFARFRQLISETFSLDAVDLDFGIHRIINLRRGEIERFLDEELPARVTAALASYDQAQRRALEEELQRARDDARRLGIDPDTAPPPRVRALFDRLAALNDRGAADDVYHHLYTFFRRYYADGDFLPLRRYKDGAYVIPYDGSDVVFSWATRDQYYIKTGDLFRAYRFALPSGRRVRFTVVEADEARDNNRLPDGADRRFLLATDDPLVEANDELVVRFEYRVDPHRRKQTAINTETIDRIGRLDGFADWKRELFAPAPTERNPRRTLLERHLATYTARNTFDYFIHKDLGGFLRRELDTYLKTEVWNLDDLEGEGYVAVERSLAKVATIRQIASSIIDFLAQIEDFQKRLWLKKKFVVETNYCVTLDRVPEDLYPEIAANDAQREEWVQLFAIDAIEPTITAPGYTVPLTTDFLKANPYLVLDTRHFSEDFKWRLLASFDDLDEQCDGLLIHSENFQALNLLMERYRGQVKCVYIDPPYNTGSDNDFAYKDDYQHGSWLSMMVDRAALARGLSASSSGIFVSTDDGEYANLRLAFAQIFGDDNFVADIIWNSRKSVSSDALISVATNHTTFFATDKTTLEQQKTSFRLPQDDEGFANPDNDPRGPWKLDPMDAPNIRENLTYPIRNPLTGEEFYPPEGRHWRFEQWQTEQLLKDGRIVFGRTGNAKPMYKRFLSEARERGRTPTTLWDDVKTTTDATKVLLDVFGSSISRELINKLKPKPHELVGRCVVLLLDGSGIVLDFFAGSGTTAHAVINLNREDGGRRKYILVEMGEYFDTVLVPRIKKAVYSKDWKDGRPVDRNGISQMIKILRLESYDDTLNNIELRRTETQEHLFSTTADFATDHLIHYLFTAEGRGSPSLVDVDRFAEPFGYKLLIGSHTVGEPRAETIDLVETFNYLIGLRVATMANLDGVRVVRGTTPNDDRVLVLWRNENDIDDAALRTWWMKYREAIDDDVDVIYVNGDTTLDRLRSADRHWTVRLTEEAFLRQMFDVEDV
jgi:adenine-specific DNA-methyltransferase